jgi:ABC-type uncharacterized transport system permease subunit
MRDPNSAVLIAGLIRPFIWLVAVYVSTRYRNWFAFVGCLIFAFTSTVSSFTFAHYPIPSWMEEAVPLVSIPGTLCILAAMMVSARNMKIYRRTIERLTRLLREEDRS